MMHQLCIQHTPWWMWKYREELKWVMVMLLTVVEELRGVRCNADAWHWEELKFFLRTIS
jgi:hypothetical protein